MRPSRGRRASRKPVAERQINREEQFLWTRVSGKLSILPSVRSEVCEVPRRGRQTCANRTLVDILLALKGEVLRAPR